MAWVGWLNGSNLLSAFIVVKAALQLSKFSAAFLSGSLLTIVPYIETPKCS